MPLLSFRPSARRPLALLLGCLLAAALPALADTPLPTHPELRSGRLGNGLGWSLLPNAHPKGQIHLWLTVDVGAMDEADDERGYAHFVEHMLFNGTARYPGNSLVTRLEALGLRFGRDSNALTGHHQTRYMLTLPDSEPARLAEALEIFREWAAHASFSPDEVIRERGVIEAEWRARQGPGQRLSPRLISAILPGSHYPERNPIGVMEQVQAAEAPRLKAFYERWYAPGNMHVLAVGDFDPRHLQGLIERTLGGLPARPFPERPPRLRPVTDGIRHLALADPERSTRAVSLAQRQPRLVLNSQEALWTHTVENLALRLASQRSATRQQGHRASLSLQLAPLPDGSRMLQARLPLAAGHSAEDGARQLLAELGDLDRNGFSLDELRPQRDLFVTGLKQLASGTTLMDSRTLIGRLEAARSNGEPLLSPRQHHALLADRLLMLEPGELNAAWLDMRASAEQLVIWEGKDFDTPPLDAAHFARLEESVRPAAAAPARKQEDVRLVRLTDPPKAGSITTIAPLDGIPGGEAWTLSNGLKALVVPSTRRGNTLTIGLHSPRGLLHLSDGNHPLAGQALSWLDRRTVNMDAEPFSRWKAQRGIGIRSSAADLGSQIIITSPDTHLEDAFQLLHLQLTRPRPVASPAQMARIRAGLKELAGNPSWQLQEAVRRSLLDDPRSTPLDSENILWLADSARARDIVRALLPPAESTVILLTPGQPTALRPFVERYLASLPAHEDAAPAARPLRRRSPPADLRLHGGTAQRTEVLLSIQGPADDASPENELALQALMRELSTRLRTELRENLGGTYSVSVSNQIDAVDKHFLGSIRFTCSPEREDELVRHTLQTFDDLLAHGLDADAIERFRRQRESAEPAQQASDESRMAAMLRSYRQDGDLLRPERTTAALAQLDAAAVNQRIRSLAPRLKIHRAAMLPAQP
ncbi:pitrilysin family protein [Zoogloea sp.]|uniref:M16 family metallopeptidase n=1 Tax=Zoogloea sp. TaxID=49181 RepID=UPI0025F39303|nr:insulinase family protein [Zoogloea sp.]MCK6372732.1 insulinase family protein [Zoogloea sp.]MCK6395709.1 insulinase family protein [Zoogloea sp.]